MKKAIVSAMIAVAIALAAFAGYGYAIRTAKLDSVYTENGSLVCYEITYGTGTTYHYGE